MNLKPLVMALTIVSSTGLFSYVASNAIAAQTATTIQTQSLEPTQEQSLASRQLATLVDETHYTNIHFDAKTSRRVLDTYLDSLDPDHSLFLQPDVDAFRKQYGETFAKRLKMGDLNPAFTIYKRYLEQINHYYQYSLATLDKPLDLNGNDTLPLEHDKAPFFKDTASQQAYWNKMLRSQLISMTISKEEEKARKLVEKQAEKAIEKPTEETTAKTNTSTPETTVTTPTPTDVTIKDPTIAAELTPVETLKKRMKRQLEQVGRQKSDRVVEVTLNALLATYDPHSNYFAPVEAMEMNRQTNLSLEGIGVSIRPDKNNEDYTKIETIMDGGPASKTGQVRAGDRIIGVAQDGEAMVDVVGWPSREIVGLIRGKRGTKVNLRLLGAGASLNQARDVSITRDVIQEKDAGVQSRVVNITRDGKDYKIGVLDIPSFYLNYTARRQGKDYRSVSEDTEKAVLELQKQNIDGMVIDLRNDPGGSLDEVARMIGMFVKEGPLVQIRDGNGNVNVFQDRDGGEQLYTGPMAVIVNLASASASEIFSAAMQDYGRAVIVGSTTTGKGTAQIQLNNLAYGQATLTQRKFYRITGGSTQNKGVIPDIPLVNIYDDEEMGERKAKNALAWDTIKTAAFKREGDVTSIIPQLLKQSEARTATDTQFNYLKKMKEIAVANKNRKEISLNLEVRKQEVKDTEAKTLATENARRTIMNLPLYSDWSAYQADMEKQNEIRAKLDADKRPPLPEEEVFITEAANVMLDSVQLQPEIPLKATVTH